MYYGAFLEIITDTAQINPAEIKEKLKLEEPIVYQAFKVSKNVASFFIDNTELILKELKKDFLYDALAYMLREFLSNAHKSNLKRIHFKLQGLDINNLEDYKSYVRNPQFICKNCGRAAAKAENLCDPECL